MKCTMNNVARIVFFNKTKKPLDSSRDYQNGWDSFFRIGLSNMCNIAMLN